MQYSFKLKADKVDSLKTRNFLPAEIDWILNEAIQAFVDNKYSDFETTQDLIDQLSSLTIKCPTNQQPAVTVSQLNDKYELKLINLAFPYLHLIRLNVLGSKQGCSNRVLRGNQVQHDDLDKVLISPFEGPNFTWSTIPYVFGKEDLTSSTNSSIYLYTNNQFNVIEAYPEYLKRPRNVFFGGYNSLNGEYTNTDPSVDCDLPEAFHRRIVDIAVMETSRILNKQDFQLAFQKVINQ